MPKRPWLRSTTTLRLKVGGRLPTDNATSSIAHVLFENAPPQIISSGEIRGGDMVAKFFRQWEKMGRPSPIVIWRYDEASFIDSVPESEGMTLEEHHAAARRLKATLESEGAKVIFRWAPTCRGWVQYGKP